MLPAFQADELSARLGEVCGLAGFPCVPAPIPGYPVHSHPKAVRNIEYEDETDASLRWQSADNWWHHCINATRRLMRETGTTPDDVAGCSVSGRAGARGAFHGLTTDTTK